MPRLLLAAAAMAMVWAMPADALPLAIAGVDRPNVETALVTKVGWRRQYWRRGYAAPYVYPPGYGYYAPPYPYAYYPPARGYSVPVPPDSGYPIADGDYADYPAVEGDYPAPMGITLMVRLRVATNRNEMSANDRNGRSQEDSGARPVSIPRMSA